MPVPAWTLVTAHLPANKTAPLRLGNGTINYWIAIIVTTTPQSACQYPYAAWQIQTKGQVMYSEAGSRMLGNRVLAAPIPVLT